MTKPESTSSLAARLGLSSRAPAFPGCTGRVDTVYLLAVEVSKLPTAAKSLLQLAERERTRWLAEAQRCSASALVLVTDGSIEFYTSEPDHLQAIGPQIRRLSEQTREIAEFRRARVIEQTGPRALRRLMNFASGLWTDARGAHRAAVELQRAPTLANANATLCPMLSALFRSAADVAGRVARETALHHPRLGAKSRDLEVPSVERIIEEELAEFRLRAQSLPAPTRRRPRLDAEHSRSFEQVEPMSQTRLRMAVPIDPVIRYLDPRINKI